MGTSAFGDYDTTLKLSPKDTLSFYGRRPAKRMSGDIAGGDADVAAAKQIDSDIVKKFEGYGVLGP